MAYFTKLLTAVQEIQKSCWDIDKQSAEYKNNITNWESIYFSRKISIWITYFLRKSPITPNQITALWFFLGITGSILLSAGNYPLSCLAVILLYTSWILDNVDGELARLRRQFSLGGDLLDMLGHQVIPPLTFGSLTLSMVLQGEPLPYIVFGLLATALVTPLMKMQENVLLLLMIKSFSAELDCDTTEQEDLNETLEKKKSLKKFLTELFGLIFTHCAILYLLIIAVLFDQTDIYLCLYGIGIPAVLIPKYFVRARLLQQISKDPQLLKKYIRPEWFYR